MKKMIACLLTAVFIGGCAKPDSQAIHTLIETSMAPVLERSAMMIPNMSKKYYNYYLPNDVGRVSAKELGDVFKKDGYDFTMTLNSSYLVQTYYDENVVSSTSGFTYQLEGTYQNFEGVSYPYRISYQALDDQRYFLFVDATIVEFMSVVPYTLIDNMVVSMMKIAESIEFDLNLVLANFSAKQLVQDTTKIDLEQFSNQVPDSGILTEHIKNK